MSHHHNIKRALLCGLFFGACSTSSNVVSNQQGQTEEMPTDDSHLLQTQVQCKVTAYPYELGTHPRLRVSCSLPEGPGDIEQMTYHRPATGDATEVSIPFFSCSAGTCSVEHVECYRDECSSVSSTVDSSKSIDVAPLVVRDSPKVDPGDEILGLREAPWFEFTIKEKDAEPRHMVFVLPSSDHVYNLSLTATTTLALNQDRYDSCEDLEATSNYVLGVDIVPDMETLTSSAFRQAWDLPHTRALNLGYLEVLFRPSLADTFSIGTKQDDLNRYLGTPLRRHIEFTYNTIDDGYQGKQAFDTCAFVLRLLQGPRHEYDTELFSFPLYVTRTFRRELGNATKEVRWQDHHQYDWNETAGSWDFGPKLP